MSTDIDREERQTLLCGECHANFIQKLHPPLGNSTYRDLTTNSESVNGIEQARLNDDLASLEAYDAEIAKLDAIRQRLMSHRNTGNMPNIASRTFRRALEMSDRRLLDLHIEFQPTSEDDIDSYYELPVPLRNIFSQVDFGGVVSFPVLERAVLENCRPFAPSAERYSHEQVNAILSAPRLHFITVGAETITKSDLRRLHVACPRLEVLSIRVHWSSDAVGGHGLLTFGALRMLVVHYDGWNPMPVLRHLAAPSLSKLVHDTDSSVCGPDMMHSMIDFIDRSGCQLQELALRVQADCVVGAGDDWYSLFGRLSGLSILKVLVLATDISRSKTAAQKLFSLMKYQGSDQHLPIHVPLPALKCLFFSIEQSEFTCLEVSQDEYGRNLFIDGICFNFSSLSFLGRQLTVCRSHSLARNGWN
ncbi:hypothetical protein AAF712_013011 [Marasmius tenuissimus]|uniref:F-box domain-containing protein n=1 Tax=Marasmius tenuissimus TaxID=585030 RepID=A0ABR2ZEZ8_9AGAR